MNPITAKNILTKKEPPELYEVVQPALNDLELRNFLVAESFAKNETLRYNCVRVIYRAAEARPDLFYSYWDRFASRLDDPNGFHRSIAAQVIALLSTADTDCRVDPIFTHYLELLDDPKVMVTHYFLETIGHIYRARPDLQGRIVTCLLSIDKTSHPAERREMLKADIIFFFNQHFDSLPQSQQKRVSDFVKKGLTSISPKTRKAAKEFEKAHS